VTDCKKILLVSNGFYPEISPRSFRATELAREFCRQGHAVVVITKFREHDYTEMLNKYPFIIKTWGKYTWPQVPDIKMKPFSLLSRALYRILSVLFEYPAIEDMFKVKKALEKEDDYDMMVSFAVPHPVHWGVAWSRSEKHRIAKVWVADCGDPFMGNILDSFKKPFYFKYLEKWFCRKADFISIPVESATPAYYPEFHGKLRIIPQGFNFNLNSKEKEKEPSNKMPEFAYAGGFLKGVRDPGAFMQFISKTDLPFKFYVFTNQAFLLDEYKEKLSGRLIVSGYIPRNELMKILAKMDFLLNFDNNTDLNVPSKLIDYAIINRPVLNIDKNFDPEELMAFLKGDYRKKMHLPDAAQYHIKNVSRLFIDLSKTNASL
jgi:hypothetical protein